MATLEELQRQVEMLQQTVNALTAPPTDYYTHRWSGEEIDRGIDRAKEGGALDVALSNKADRQLSNLSSVQQALANLGAGVRPNLLDNPYFVGGGSQLGSGVFPINQRGLTLYGPGTSLNRWTCDGNVSINKDYVSFNSVFYQNVPWSKMESLLGKTLTLSVFFDENNAESGTITLANSYQNQQIVPTSTPVLQLVVDPNGACQLFRYANGASPKAVKCENGPDQTLFYQKSDGTYALLPQPDMDYETQLAKCQSYGEAMVGGRAHGIATSSTFLAITYPFFVRKRVSPVFNAEEVTLTNLLFDNTAGNMITPDSIIPRGYRTGGAILGFTGNFMVGHDYSIILDGNGGFFNAEL